MKITKTMRVDQSVIEKKQGLPNNKENQLPS